MGGTLFAYSYYQIARVQASHSNATGIAVANLIALAEFLSVLISSIVTREVSEQQ